MLESWLNNTEVDLSDVKPKSLKLKNLIGKDYILHESGAYSGSRYRSSLINVVNTPDKDGKPGGMEMKINSEIGLADLVLVETCLFELTENNFEKPVTKEFVATIPDSIFQRIVEWIKTNSNLKQSDPKE